MRSHTFTPTTCTPWPTRDEVANSGDGSAIELVGRSLEHLGYVALSGSDIKDKAGRLAESVLGRISILHGTDTSRIPPDGGWSSHHVIQLLRPLKCLEIVEAESAEEFLDYLTVTRSHWRGGPECSWIFRGQADASWFLQPSAWRAAGRQSLRPLLPRVKKEMALGKEQEGEIAADTPTGRQLAGRLHRATEYAAIRTFGELADRLGLRVPEAESFTTVRDFLESDYGWPDDDWCVKATVACLAQHHGIPTSLLDWTENPLTAAFFAAEGAKAECDDYAAAASLGEDGPSGAPPGEFAVWALDRDSIPTITIPVEGYELGVLTAVRCPRSDHSFLHAQEGLFLRHPGCGRYFLNHGAWPVFEEVLDDAYKGDARPLRKITLPKGLSDSVLRNLWRLGYFRAKLMPTFDNISRSVKQRWQF